MLDNSILPSDFWLFIYKHSKFTFQQGLEIG